MRIHAIRPMTNSTVRPHHCRYCGASFYLHQGREYRIHLLAHQVQNLKSSKGGEVK